MFVIRAAFWLTVIVFLLPQAPQAPQGKSHELSVGAAAGAQAGDKADVAGAETAKLAAVSTGELVNFCERHAEACASAGTLALDFKDAALDAYRNAGTWIAVLREDQRKNHGTGLQAGTDA